MMLIALILIPLLSALAVMCTPQGSKHSPRFIAVGATGVTAILGIVMFLSFNAAEGMNFHFKKLWVDSLQLYFHVGADGLNIGLILMGSIVAFAATLVSWDIQKMEKEFYALLLVMIGGVLGAFASQDLFWFYFFHELALVPTFIMIGVWGSGKEQNYATFQITIYLTLGALIALVGLVLLYVKMPQAIRTFDIAGMAQHYQTNPLSAGDQTLIFALLLFGFGILVSLWPFHTWAPIGYGSAPTGNAMMHAGVLKKFGLYGLLKIALPMLPIGSQRWLPILALLCLGNLLHCGWVAMRQKNLNLLIGNSSVAHMGFCFLGIASLTVLGLTGTVVIMIAHGFLAALSYALTGYLRSQTGTLEMDKFGGLLQRMPFFGTVLMIALFAGCGLPGFANFAGEILVLFGGWKSTLTGSGFVVAAAWAALIIGGVYMLRAIRTILHGPLPVAWANVVDVPRGRMLPYAVLVGALVVFGVKPQLLTDAIQPSVESIVKMASSGRTIPAPPTPTPAKVAQSH